MAGSISQPVLNPGALGMYNQLLNLNQQNYGNILQGYQSGQQQLSNQLGSINAGYGTVQNNVLNALGVTGGGWGVAALAAQQIARNYAQTQGQNTQSLLNAGLGNSTLLANVLNKGQLQANQAYGSLGAQLAQTAAGYESQIGLAQLASRMQGLGLQNSLTQSYLGNLAGFHFANTFGNLYGQQSVSGYGGGGGGYGGAGGSGGLGWDPFTAGMFGNSTPPVNASGYGYSPAYATPNYGGFGGYGSGAAPQGSVINASDFPEPEPWDVAFDYGGE